MANWFYVRDGEQTGPCNETQIQELVAAGQITAETLLWTDGMPDWLPYSQVSDQMGAAPIAPEAGSVVCPTCGRVVTPEDLAQVGNTQVCPHCKAGYVQRLKEGVDVGTTDYEYAGFWIRVGAQFIDGICMWLVFIPLMILMGIANAMADGNEVVAIVGFIIYQGLSILIPMAYFIFFWGNPRFQATPGKMACRLKIITPEAERVTYLRALGRYFAHMLSGMIFCIGYLLCIWDDEKRCLHDMICNTRVVRVPRSR